MNVVWVSAVWINTSFGISIASSGKIKIAKTFWKFYATDLLSVIWVWKDITLILQRLRSQLLNKFVCDMMTFCGLCEFGCESAFSILFSLYIFVKLWTVNIKMNFSQSQDISLFKLSFSVPFLWIIHLIVNILEKS